MRVILAALMLALIVAMTGETPAAARGYSVQTSNWSWRQSNDHQQVRKHHRIRHVKRHRRASTIAARLSPAIAKPGVTASPQILRTPFGVAIKTLVNLAVISPPLVTFVRQVASECGGATVISGMRSSGTVRNTCHRGGHALDYQTPNPKCALQVANKTRGIGHSIDYYGVAAKFGRGMPVHYHVSDCRREVGARFAHGGGRKIGRTRYARHHRRHRHRRYARAYL